MRQDRAGVHEGPTEMIFCLRELLKLQVSIARSLEVAWYAFRHADGNLAADFRWAHHRARELSQNTAGVVSRYADVAMQVNQTVLPDLRLAVQEKEPALAVSLLGMVKTWVDDLQEVGSDMQYRYVQLSTDTRGLIDRAQQVKTESDRRLALGEADPERSPAALERRSLAPESLALLNAAEEQQPSLMLNSWTRHLFEELAKLVEPKRADSYPGGVTPSTTVRNDGSVDDPTEVRSTGMLEEDGRRDLLDLLFMAPGVNPTSISRARQPFDVAMEVVGSCDRTDSAATAATASSFGGAGSGSEGGFAISGSVLGGFGGKGGGFGSVPADAKRGFQENEDAYGGVDTRATPWAQASARSSAGLLRALGELRRVDEILNGICGFWANMDCTVRKLSQLKEHTECLLTFASTDSSRLRERFDQRLAQYSDFWAALERLCRQYVDDHAVVSQRMYELANDTSNLVDVADSARILLVPAAAAEKPQHGLLRS
eukprot:TRINITY_DN21791_c0_g1_i1.p1 TRINITY_DN21791_c0_g1~~TRINITY_DN21791_c0_g1_i1.p1  ORF type:complete len:487 (+),score=104.24 TRINITY_DN21791_c0_g1_i1:174-1634(+)